MRTTAIIIKDFHLELGGFRMHLADGVLNLPTAVATYGITAGLLGYSIKNIKEEEMPRISLMTGAFFAVSLISIPVGPSSIHPFLGGLMGVILGRHAPLAFFVGLLLQAVLFQHGGLTTLGANTVMLALPALLVYRLFHGMGKMDFFLKGALAGGLAVVGTVFILIITLLFSDQRFGDGFFSVVNLLIVGHLPLVVIEGLITGFALKLLHTAKPDLLEQSRNQ